MNMGGWGLVLDRWAGWSADQVGRHVKCCSRRNEKQSR